MNAKGRLRMMMVAGLAGLVGSVPTAFAQGDPPPPAAPRAAPTPPEFPPFAEVSKDYEKVVSTADGEPSLYTLWVREKDGQILAELPRGYQGQKHLIAGTLAAGDIWAGLHSGIFTADADRYFYWKRYDKRMAMISPQIGTRSTGDQQSKDSVGRQFTDRVLMDVPIVCMGPNGQPVIDLDELLAGRADQFFGADAAGANPKLMTIERAKAFPHNVEIQIELPVRGGVLKTFHYSIRTVPDSSGYQPRQADERIGYFTTAYRDLGKFRDDQKWVRYVNRWKLEKADPSLKMSPPKEPIVFYIEDTIPVRYRRFVRDGVLKWNKAFEKVGIKDAIEVHYQDKASNQHMDKDPEDARYNFIRWLSNDMGTAVGPSRTHPLTGQILDADIVLTDGWIRYFWYQSNEFVPENATHNMTPETIQWLDKNPEWDPRLRLAKAVDRDRILAERAMKGVLKYGGQLSGDGQPTPGYAHSNAELRRDNWSMMSFAETRACNVAKGKSYDMALMGMSLEVMGILDDADDDKPAKGDKDGEETPKKGDNFDTLDGIPEWFIGPMLSDLVCHEVGHTLGLRHNFKASSIYSLADVNSDKVKGKPFTGSVMDYTPININMETGKLQGDFCMTDVGPYDLWAIEYGYTFGDPKEVLKRVAEPDLAYGTDEDTIGPDPLIRRYDFTGNPLDFATSRLQLINYHRGRLVDSFVKDGQSWSRTRRGYMITLNEQTRMLSMMSAWLGSSNTTRDRKGDPNGRLPIEVVAADTQRAALNFIIENAFRDEAFGLSPDLLVRMTVDKWADQGGMSDLGEDPTWAVHDRVSGVQASALTMIMNPTVLKRVYDNEFRVPSEKDALTLPEMMDTVTGAIFTEVKGGVAAGSYTPRKPLVSSLRRNLQREYVDRLIDLTMPGQLSGAAAKPVSTLAQAELKAVRKWVGADANGIDAYTKAHFDDLATRIDRALDAQYIYNQDGNSLPPYFFFGQTTPDAGRVHEGE